MLSKPDFRVDDSLQQRVTTMEIWIDLPISPTDGKFQASLY